MTRQELDREKEKAAKAATALCVVIINAARCRKDALEGIEAITRDMRNNVNAFYDEFEQEARQ